MQHRIGLTVAAWTLPTSSSKKLFISGGSLFLLLSLISHLIITISPVEYRQVLRTLSSYPTQQVVSEFYQSKLSSLPPSAKTVPRNEIVKGGEHWDAEEDEYLDWELDNYKVVWGALEDYQLMAKLGEGEYAEVFESIDLRNNRTCVTKILKPVSEREVKREIKILKDLVGGPNIVQLLDTVSKEGGDSPALVMEYVNNTYYKKLYPTLTDMEVRYYMVQLLRAIEFAHSKGIMHRDIKPHNLLIEHENKKLRLIDWGLSDYFDENYAYTTSIASRFWRAPEILVGHEWYNLSSDMWAFGCLLAGIVFSIEPFFYGRDDEVDQLIKVAQILGTEDLFNWLDKYEIQLPETFNNVSAWYEKISLKEFVDQRNYARADNDVLDLLNRILLYDHHARLNATEALAHCYFDPVRKQALEHESSATKWPVDSLQTVKRP